MIELNNMIIEPQAQAAWSELTAWQQSEVMRRYSGYVDSPANRPPKDIIYAPVTRQTSPGDWPEVVPNVPQPEGPMIRKARFQLRKHISGNLMYTLAGIE